MSGMSLEFKAILGEKDFVLPEVYDTGKEWLYRYDDDVCGVSLRTLCADICAFAPNTVFLGKLYTYSSKTMETDYENLIFSKDGYEIIQGFYGFTNVSFDDLLITEMLLDQMRLASIPIQNLN